MSGSSSGSGSGIGPNGIVDGTTGSDLILPFFIDADGDQVDGFDGDDDTIFAFEGDDTVVAGAGNDSVKGGTGDDLIYGDSDLSDEQFDGIVRESFEWDKAPDPNGPNPIEDEDPLSHFTQNTGNVDVTFTVTDQSSSRVDHEFSDEHQFVGGIDDGSESIDAGSGLVSDLTGDGDGSANFELGFSTPVENADFRINDIDGSGMVTVTAELDGVPVTVNLTGGSKLDVSGNTARTDNPGPDEYAQPNEDDFSARVQIDGPFDKIKIEHSEGDFNSGIWVTDVYYDAPVADPGTGGDDTLLGGAGADEIYGEGGDDSIEGGAGADLLSGGDGTNILRGGDEDDTFVGGDGADSFDGGRDEDVIDYSTSGAAVTVNLSTSSLSGGDADNDTIINGIDGAIGSNHDDLLVGFNQQGTSDPNVFSNFFDGGAGNDTIDGRGGDDVLIGGDGSDSVIGGSGDDTIDTSGSDPLPDDGFGSVVDEDPNQLNDRDTVDGGGGDDSINTGDDADWISGGAGDDTIDGGLDDDEIYGADGDDEITAGEGSDTVFGGRGDDTIYGGIDDPAVNIPDPIDPELDNGDDSLLGGGGDDLIFGEDDNDTLEGGAGEDTLHGGVDDDTIIGGAGADTMTGGADRDTFIITSVSDADGDDVDGGTLGDDFDTLDLTGLGPFERVGETTDPDGDSTSGTINFLDSPGGSVTGSMTYSEIERIVPCFTPGTVIATPYGERPVEDLRPGDRVITRDNGLQEIRWAGRRDLGTAELGAAPHMRPVLIRAGALGRGLPERDMLVSPQHRVLMNNDKTALYFEDREVLAAAKHLTGLEGVDEVREASGVSYIHFMFDQHEVVLSNGAWTESFQPGEQTLDGMGEESRAEILELFPELAEAEGIRAYQSARRSLKKHEAGLLVAE
ncbi:type I secretion protein [Roseovarius sp. TE539]|uniref:Hint domain-containing protein n=1 Tax=Roseovarius sp. TE539 TaxID=2249812 RepID=UPI000DE1472D|nr:Hint domain-containing protein [Roseovarius sp. TE539]RBI70555.1 type I secretion protein [Roseovarius sp. TE539]